MKTLVILLLSISNAYAGQNLVNFFNSYQAESICKKSRTNFGGRSVHTLRFIQGDENEAYFAFSLGNLSKIIINDLRTGLQREIKLEGKIRDIVIYEREVFYLSDTTLFVADRYSDRLIGKIRTLPLGLNYFKDAYARGVYAANGYIYIAHGLYGIVKYDRYSNRYMGTINPSVPQPQVGHRSMITDVEGVNGKLYFTYDDSTLSRSSKAFEGLMIWDIATNSQHRLIPLNQNKEAYFMSNLTINNDELVVTNLNLNFRHKLSSLEGDREMNPLQRIWSYPKGELIGRSLIKDNQIFGCFENINTNMMASGHVNFK